MEIYYDKNKQTTEILLQIIFYHQKVFTFFCVFKIYSNTFFNGICFWKLSVPQKGKVLVVLYFFIKWTLEPNSKWNEEQSGNIFNEFQIDEFIRWREYSPLYDILKKEIEEAKKICTKNKWSTIDVPKKSIEEIAATALEFFKIFKSKKLND